MAMAQFCRRRMTSACGSNGAEHEEALGSPRENDIPNVLLAEERPNALRVHCIDLDGRCEFFVTISLYYAAMTCGILRSAAHFTRGKASGNDSDAEEKTDATTVRVQFELGPDPAATRSIVLAFFRLVELLSSNAAVREATTTTTTRVSKADMDTDSEDEDEDEELCVTRQGLAAHARSQSLLLSLPGGMARRVKCRLVYTEARRYLLHMHALARYFDCRLVVHWVEAQFLSGKLSDRAMVHVMAYVSSHVLPPPAPPAPTLMDNDATATATAPVVTRHCMEIDVRRLYTLASIWHYCLRPVRSVAQKESHNFLALDTDNVTTLRTSFSGSNGAELYMSGTFSKCLRCSDTNLRRFSNSNGGGTMETIIHEASEIDGCGIWSVLLTEESSPEGTRHLTLRRLNRSADVTLPPSVPLPPCSRRDVRDSLVYEPTRCVDYVCDALRARRTDPHAACYACQAARQDSSAYGAPCERRRYRWKSNILLVKKTSAQGESASTSNFLDREFTAEADMDVSACMRVSSCSIPLPPHWRSRDYVVGRCAVCRRSDVRVAVLVYKFQVVRTKNYC